MQPCKPEENPSGSFEITPDIQTLYMIIIIYMINTFLCNLDYYKFDFYKLKFTKIKIHKMYFLIRECAT